jgi:purine nucleosidase
MNFPKISNITRLERLQPPVGKIRMVIDTDTYNEIDDQFAIVYALFSPEKLSVEGIYAAPFFNRLSTSAGNGMELSYDEILRLLDKLDVRSLENIVFRGSDGFLSDYDHPYASDAVEHLIKLAMASDEPLYVAALGALTNIASAILIEPKIIEKIVIVWLGGQAFHWPNTNEFNLAGDMLAARLIFDCGVPMVLIPCLGVTSHLRTTVSEIDQFVAGKSLIGDFLAETFKAYRNIRFGGSKEIWDIVVMAYLLNAEWIPSYITSSPMVTQQPPLKEPGPNPYPREKHQLTWSFDHSRHAIRYAYYVHRDPIFTDLFTKLDRFAKGELDLKA